MNSTLERNTQEYRVLVTTNSVSLKGDLAIPKGAEGIVLFAHGCGSSRHSPRNRYVSKVLQKEGLATLLIDLLTSDEEVTDMQTQLLCFDIGLLASRLVGATDWLLQNPTTGHLKIGYFGASTGSAAALIAATERPELVGAIVSRGGRPDLAGSALSRIRTPTLLIVGGNDFPVIDMNEDALKYIRAQKQLTIIPGATHMFEEPGALEKVALFAKQWFKNYLAS
jgi:putative phosphoribosyl transferase